MKTAIINGTLVNEGKTFRADIIVENDTIVSITDKANERELDECKVIDAEGMYVIPGVIDDHVHFREPGLTHKGDMAEGSRAAAAGGVTSFMDMPNVIPPTTTLASMHDRQEIGAEKSLVNYSFYLGAANDNFYDIRHAYPVSICVLKVFMGSSTGNLLIDDRKNLERIFAESPLIIATHCEDNDIIEHNLQHFRSIYGDNIPPECHPLIRSREACLKSSRLAVELARKYNNRLHILHLTTEEEINLLDKGDLSSKRITGEACVQHLWFNDSAYKEKGNFVKCNPAIKKESDRQALLKAVNGGIIDVVATDHAPHTIEEKSGIYTKAASGAPMVQHSLAVMLELAERGETTFTTIVERMSHTPAKLFRITKRGFLRTGYKADICIFKKEAWTVDKSNILYKCGWSPLEGVSLNYKVQTTLVNGRIVYDKGLFDDSVKGEMLEFEM
ncbi:MAG: dihydroorotase [Culturomica sp.]|jgi:dihydroorotase|nr:dihydroorotase [Culturomica sp.]